MREACRAGICPASKATATRSDIIAVIRGSVAAVPKSRGFTLERYHHQILRAIEAAAA